ncbi:tetratricopeptide repeat protein [Candidatus Binatia bacterium]|nr:tetratricopeptide repeat protein [Candidatus Binatia bacterium]
MNDPAFRERYELLELIGSGAYAKVYRAVRRSTGQEVAVKIVTLDEGLDARAIDEQIAQLRHEVAICERLLHPNIVRLVDSGAGSARSLYAVFAHVAGWNLADLVTLHGPLPRATALHLMAQVLDALATAHASGVVHRDVKPDNVVVRVAGEGPSAMVLDFGIGVLAGASGRWGSHASPGGDLLGTPAYSAPEQLRGEPVTGAADLYAWGLTTIEVLTGERVMAGPTLQETVFRQLSSDPVPLPGAIADGDLGALLREVCAKDVARRAANASEVLRRLEPLRALGDPAALALPASLRGDATPLASSRPVVVRPGRGLSTIPLLRNPRFTGREDALAEIAQRLRVSAVLAVCALKGIGGVGKTQLALEYAYRHRHEYDLVGWIRAENPGTLDADLAALAGVLGLPEATAPEDHRRIRAVREWLDTHDHWLLVFDNVVEPRAIRSYLPRNRAGHVLITSRHQSWHDLACAVDVDVMSAEEAARLLLSRSGDDDVEAARELAALLGYLPLALEEAAAYVQATGRTLRDYVALFREHQGRLLAASLPPADYPTTLCTTWDMSLQRLASEEPAAVDLLTILAHLAPERVPRFLFLPPRSGADAGIAPPAPDEAALDRQLAALLRYSLVRVDDDEIFIHRLLQAVIRDRMSEPERAAATERTLLLVEQAFPRSGSAGRARPECTRLLPHAVAALGHARWIDTGRIAAARLLQRTGVYLSACGWSEDAVKHLERAVAVFGQAGPAHEAEHARAAEDLGMVFYQLGLLVPAARAHERAIATLADGPHRDVVRAGQALINLAWVRWSEGALAAASDVARRGVALLQDAPGAGGLSAVGALAILARVLFDRGDVDGARTTVDAALDVLARIPGPHHPLLCGTLLQVSQVLTALGRIQAARPLALEAVQAGERAYGRHHPLVAGTYSVLGQIHELLEDDETAREHFAKAVASAQAAANRVDQHVAIAACLSVRVLVRLGRLAEAADALLAAEGLLSKLCGARERFAAELLLASARVDTSYGKSDAAAEKWARGHAALRASAGPAHPTMMDALLLVADVHDSRADLPSAVVAIEGALEVARVNRLQEHPLLIKAHDKLATICERTTRHDDAVLHRQLANALRHRLRAASR